MLATLYERGENTYTSEDVAKVVVVHVERRKYTLSQEAQQTFEDIHDNWEMNICKAYHHDILLSGKTCIYVHALDIQSLKKINVITC